MYVPFERFTEATVSDVTMEHYARLAPIADMLIDDWTLGRVGKAVGNGCELPSPVIVAYTAIIEALPPYMEQSKGGGLVSSFSNGVDSYSFDVSGTMAEQIHRQLGWILNAMPVEWMSGVVSYEGGCDEG